MVHLVGYWNGSVQLNDEFAIVDEYAYQMF